MVILLGSTTFDLVAQRARVETFAADGSSTGITYFDADGARCFSRFIESIYINIFNILSLASNLLLRENFQVVPCDLRGSFSW